MKVWMVGVLLALLALGCGGGVSTNNTPTPSVRTEATEVPKYKRYTNCRAMRKDYPNGVKKGHRAYSPKLDQDEDGRACEKR